MFVSRDRHFLRSSGGNSSLEVTVKSVAPAISHGRGLATDLLCSYSYLDVGVGFLSRHDFGRQRPMQKHLRTTCHEEGALEHTPLLAGGASLSLDLGVLLLLEPKAEVCIRFV